MSIDFRNTNTIWASVLVETLHRLGLATAIICPGSRSAPLAVAFAQHPKIEAIPILDERSAAFFALGLARKSHRAIVLVCTSGTAGANFYPAIIEATESRVPLLVLTADRPPELRHCNAGQAIDQQKLYGSYPNFYAELAIPSSEAFLLAYLRQTLMQAWQQAHYPLAGVVHLNVPFREPLAPIAQPETQALAASFPIDFFDHAAFRSPVSAAPLPAYDSLSREPFDRALIVAGPAQPDDPQVYCQAIANLSKTLGIPVLAEGLSPVRNYASLNPYLVSTYDVILRNPQWGEKLAPEKVIRIGDMPTSKTLRQWLAATQPQQWVIDPSDRSLDPLHGKTIHIPASIEAILPEKLMPSTSRDYLEHWCSAESQIRRTIDQAMDAETTLFEGKAAWLLSQYLPKGTPLFVANSMPVRDVECFWMPTDSAVQPFFSRGANGIDGTLSTALGMAHRSQSSVLLTGDLSLLHDTNGFLIRDRFAGSLTIVLINNNGGGIFGMLPIAQFNPPFEEFFATPQTVDFARLCQTYAVNYEQITTWEQLIWHLNPLPKTGIRVLELQTDRSIDAQWRQNNLGSFAASLTPTLDLYDN